MKKDLPGKTIERLSQYRRSLINCLQEGTTHVFSHELANLHHITPVQVRRDIMLIGYTGTLRKGYDVKELIGLIGTIIDNPEGERLAVVGLGNLGRAIVSYFKGKRSKLYIGAAFDVDPDLVGRMVNGVKCYHVVDMIDVIRKEDLRIGIITVPTDEAHKTAENLVHAGVKGILNFTSVNLKVPDGVYLEEYDIITFIEKVAYFSRQGN